VAVLIVWGLTDVRRRARIEDGNPTAHKTDFTVYTEAGAAFFDGRDPYDVANPRGWHYLYPPLFALLVAPLAALGTQTQALVWYLVSLLACYGTWRECRRLWLHVSSVGNALGLPGAACGQRAIAQAAAPIAPKSILWLAAAAITLPALNCLQRGQVGIVLVYLLLLGLRFVVTSESVSTAVLGGFALALAATIKVTPLLPAGVLALALIIAGWQRSRTYSSSIAGSLGHGPLNHAFATSAGGALGLLVFLFIVPAMAIGHGQNIAHLQTWVSRVAANDDVGIDNDFNVQSKRNQSLTNAVKRLGNRLAFAWGAGPDDRLVDDLAQQQTPMPMASPVVDRAMRLVFAALVALLLAAAWRVAGRRHDTLDLAALFGLACAATLVVSPISWGHHYVMWLPALVFVPLWLWRDGRCAMALAMAETAVVVIVAHYVVLDHAGRVGLLGIATAVWYVAGTWAVGWPLRREKAADAVNRSIPPVVDFLPPQRRAA
jgi:hypothetical protein